MHFLHLLLCWADEQRLLLIAMFFCTAPPFPSHHACCDCAFFLNCRTSSQIFSPVILTLLIHAFLISLDRYVYFYCCFNTISCTSFKPFSQWLCPLNWKKIKLINTGRGIEQKNIVLSAYFQQEYSCQKHRFKVAGYIPTVGGIY